MHGLGESRLIRSLLSVALLTGSVPFPAGAQPAPGTDRPASVAPPAAPETPAEPPSAVSQPPGDLNTSLDQAREFIKTRDYDNAIEILTAAIEAQPNQTDLLREAYLLLIKTWVFLGAENEQRQQGRETAKLNYQHAKELITECLSIKELRHTRPEPVTEYPDKMISLFAEVRSETFGSFRVSELRPPDAVVLLDADTLRSAPGQNFLAAEDIAVGRHVVVVRAKGHKNLAEEIEIKPGSILEQPYRLDKNKTTTWYAVVGAGVAGVVAAVIALTGPGETTSEPPPASLPGPPPPPPARSP